MINKLPFLLSLFSFSAFLLLSGCGRDQASKASSSHGNEEKHAGESAYSPGKGLTLPPKAQENIGIKTAEVSLARLISKKNLEAQVFRLAGELSVSNRYFTGNAYATALLPLEHQDVLKVGQSTALQTPDGTRLTGHLTRIDRQLTEINGQIELILEIPDPAKALSMGTSLIFQVEGSPEKAEEAVVIPEEALLKTAKGDFVYVLNGESYLRTEIKRGASREGQVQVIEGILEGDVVVIQGLQGLYLAELQAVNAGTGCTHGH